MVSCGHFPDFKNCSFESMLTLQETFRTFRDQETKLMFVSEMNRRRRER